MEIIFIIIGIWATIVFVARFIAILCIKRFNRNEEMKAKPRDPINSLNCSRALDNYDTDWHLIPTISCSSDANYFYIYVLFLKWRYSIIYYYDRTV